MAHKTFIRFEELPFEKPCKTLRWIVLSVSTGGPLGSIEFLLAWRQYVFMPADNTEWSTGCLRDVIAFMDAQNLIHRTKEEAT